MNSAVKGHGLLKRRESLGRQLCLSGTPEDKGEPGAKTMSPYSLGTDEKIALVMSRAMERQEGALGSLGGFSTGFKVILTCPTGWKPKYPEE